MASTENSKLDLDSLPEFVTPEEYRRIMRVGRSAMYDALARGEIEHTKIGRLKRIHRSAILRAAGRSA